MGILQAEGAILGLFQDTGPHDPQRMTNMEKRWRQHRTLVFHGMDPAEAPTADVRGGLLMVFRAVAFTVEEVQDAVDVAPGKARALHVVTVGGVLTIINVHGPGSGAGCWATEASFLANIRMCSCLRRPRVLGARG